MQKAEQPDTHIATSSKYRYINGQRVSILSLYFISISIIRQGKCINYNYGGCFGTKNLFDTQDECETECPSQINAPRTSTMWIQPPFCKEPPIQGIN